MGFMDKAKKMAEQAQAKLDEAQHAFNERQESAHPPGAGTPAPDAPATQYDQHGRLGRVDHPGGDHHATAR